MNTPSLSRYINVEIKDKLLNNGMAKKFHFSLVANSLPMVKSNAKETSRRTRTSVLSSAPGTLSLGNASLKSRDRRIRSPIPNGSVLLSSSPTTRAL